ncbi:MAG: hypothetical protein M3Q57_00305 [Pseudomonadota bacterium]|nr:hypothetical protein [Pseudomonadota bacterium]
MSTRRNSSVAVAIGAALLAACGEREASIPSNMAVVEPEAPAPDAPAPDAPAKGRQGWELLSSGEGTALRLVREGASAVHLFCPSRSGRLAVNVAGFKPIVSEERLSLGSDGTAIALVADSGGDALRGGVTGEGPVPEELGAILSGPISASYGAQTVGPLPAPSEADRTALLSACAKKASTPVPPKPTASSGACYMQDGERLTMTPLRAIGTEPFWGARIEGRCVIYSTPEDQAGTRIWTKFNPGPDGGIWSGALGGRQFELRTRPAPPPGCSDGMSDNRYPQSVTLRVRGETRTGCAKPL